LLKRPDPGTGGRVATLPRSLTLETWNLDLLRILIAILLPPLGVFLQVGFRGAFWLNILLTLLGYFPGIIHAVWIIARR
jgi:uncharacterized membrane protein YqaE (UPF0057 family)